MVVVGKKVCSTEWKSETLKYPLRSTVAIHCRHLIYNVLGIAFNKCQNI